MTEATLRWAFAIHGGAGAVRSDRNEEEVAHMRALLERGADLLDGGAEVLDVVVALAEAMEASGLYVAGKGSMPNAAGAFELDASVMHGPTGRAGAVAALQGFASPVLAARAVMEETPHVLLVGEGAADFCAARGMARVEDPRAYYTPASSRLGAEVHGTIGVVARDTTGALAAATSTGGTSRKFAGRVGDTALIGAGTWADSTCAISCTGQGEYFIRANAAAECARRMRLAGEDVARAASQALGRAAAIGGKGGLIAVDAAGRIAAPFNTEGMRRAMADSSGLRDVRIFD